MSHLEPSIIQGSQKAGCPEKEEEKLNGSSLLCQWCPPGMRKAASRSLKRKHGVALALLAFFPEILFQHQPLSPYSSAFDSGLDPLRWVMVLFPALNSSPEPSFPQAWCQRWSLAILIGPAILQSARRGSLPSGAGDLCPCVISTCAFSCSPLYRLNKAGTVLKGSSLQSQKSRSFQ